jgi:HEAT repeat protein
MAMNGRIGAHFCLRSMICLIAWAFTAVPSAAVWAQTDSYVEGDALPRTTVPRLIAALRTRDQKRQHRVAQVLESFGREAVGPLAGALGDADPSIRAGAAVALGRLSADAVPAVPALIAALGDSIDATEVAVASDQELSNDQNPVSKGPSVVEQALAAIGRPAVAPLIHQLDAPDPGRRRLAVRALKFLQSDARIAIPRLVRLLKDHEVRFEAASALASIGNGERELILPLIVCLKDSDAAFRACAARALGNMKLCEPLPADSPLIPFLAMATRDAEPRVRAAGALAFGNLSSVTPAPSPLLCRLLHDTSADVRLAALDACGRFSRPGQSRDMVPLLLEDPDPRIRRRAAAVVRAEVVGNTTLLAALIPAIADRDHDVRLAALHNLSGAGGCDVEPDPPAGQSVVRERFARVVAASRDQSPRVRAAAARVLAQFTSCEPETVAALRVMLKDGSATVRAAAAVALGELGSNVGDAVPDLFEALDDPELDRRRVPHVSVSAAQALVAIGGVAGTKTMCLLRERLGSRNSTVHARADAALRQLGDEAVPTLIEMLVDPATSRSMLIEVLELLDATATRHLHDDQSDQLFKHPNELRAALPLLRSLARDDDSAVSLCAFRLLATAENGADELVDAFLSASRDQSPFTMLEFIRRFQPTAIPRLLRGLKDPDEDVRTAVAYVLAGLDDDQADGALDAMPAAPAIRSGAEKNDRQASRLDPATDAILGLMHDPDTQVRWAAAYALGQLGPHRSEKKDIDALIEMLHDKTTRVREGAEILLESVERYGNGSRSDGQTARGEKMRLAAIQSLGNFEAMAAPAVPALIDATHDADPLTALFAVLALGRIGPDAKPAVPALISRLSVRDTVHVARATGMPGQRTHLPVAAAAAEALGKIGPDASSAVPALIAALADPRSDVRRIAATALGAIGADAKAAVPALVLMLEHDAPSLASSAAEALAQIGLPARSAVSKLSTILVDPRQVNRIEAAQALGAIGTDAIPVLYRFQTDPDPAVREAVCQSIELISAAEESSELDDRDAGGNIHPDH